MNCIHCKGAMRRGVAPFSIDRKGYHVRWDAIPAWICSQCGEPCFEEHEVALIQATLKTMDEKTSLLLQSAA